MDQYCSLLGETKKEKVHSRMATAEEKLDGSTSWIKFEKMHIEDYLYRKDLHEPLSGVRLDSMTTKQ